MLYYFIMREAFDTALSMFASTLYRISHRSLVTETDYNSVHKVFVVSLGRRT